MPKFLRQSTASTLCLGPFVSAADGKTPITAITTFVGSIIANGVITGNYTPGNIACSADGYVTFTAGSADTAAAGQLRIEVPAGNNTWLPVWDDWMVLAPSAYDALITGNGTGILANTPAGTGSIAINHNTGGTDNLRYIDSAGNGIAAATVLIYLAADWPNNPGNIQAATTTGSDGRWLAPCMVTHGTYVAVFSKVGLDGPDVSPSFTV